MKDKHSQADITEVGSFVRGRKGRGEEKRKRQKERKREETENVLLAPSEEQGEKEGEWVGLVF